MLPKECKAKKTQPPTGKTVRTPALNRPIIFGNNFKDTLRLLPNFFCLPRGACPAQALQLPGKLENY
jgi:hypothetical protein